MGRCERCGSDMDAEFQLARVRRQNAALRHVLEFYATKRFWNDGRLVYTYGDGPRIPWLPAADVLLEIESDDAQEEGETT